MKDRFKVRKILDQNKVETNAANAINSFHANIVQEVESAIKSNDLVVVGMGQNPVVKKARRILDEKKLAYHYLEYGSYLSKWKQRLAIKLWSGWPTFPQVYHKGVLIGGAEDLERYIKNGKL